MNNLKPVSFVCTSGSSMSIGKLVLVMETLVLYVILYFAILNSSKILLIASLLLLLLIIIISLHSRLQPEGTVLAKVTDEGIFINPKISPITHIDDYSTIRVAELAMSKHQILLLIHPVHGEVWLSGLNREEMSEVASIRRYWGAPIVITQSELLKLGGSPDDLEILFSCIKNNYLIGNGNSSFTITSN